MNVIHRKPSDYSVTMIGIGTAVALKRQLITGHACI